MKQIVILKIRATQVEEQMATVTNTMEILDNHMKLAMKDVQSNQTEVV